MKQLPVFKGYTVDVRLKQFRKVSPNRQITFVDFKTEQGDKLLSQYIASLDVNNPEHKEILTDIWS